MNNYFRQYVAKLCTTRKYHTLQLINLVLAFFVSRYHFTILVLDLDSFDHLVDDSLGSLIPSK